ncbi:2-oxoglutarate and iron-dependent oxygenase JMJD4 [Schistocerca gregaria]|uniref:2-oxoglutarate and iron-dependent oxygenase JMJD4 n=1 Tax=Schistocerca gregaria TaxID=7010 RepID=UPI00211DDCAC|nr:2-oxoglutarate and iron-dependent oxygenase JMJD4 [Schistocerca gregaria]
MCNVEQASVVDIKSEIPNCSQTSCGIPVVGDDLSYAEFFENFMLKNCPVIIKGNFTKEWECATKWVKDDKPMFSYLNENFGQTEVPVADCGRRHYNVQEKSTFKLCDYLDYWSDYIRNDYPETMPCFYLKDWHFTRDFPQHLIYRTPQYFASDWLNEYYYDHKNKNDDYRFVYMGPKGSWTPFHADVFTSFSWSVNICGQKRWLLFPPGQESFLRNKFGNLPYDCTSEELKNEDLFPEYKKLNPPYEILQQAGEAVFVPSGWHHQVWNMKDTISINHNWVNGCNIKTMWLSLKNHLAAVKKEIEDCKEMEEWNSHCQIMLRASFGLDYEEFYRFLLHISKKRIDSLHGKDDLIVYGNWRIGRNHIVFDLLKINEVLNLFLSDTDCEIVLKELDVQKPKDLLSEINSVL